MLFSFLRVSFSFFFPQFHRFQYDSACSLGTSNMRLLWSWRDWKFKRAFWYLFSKPLDKELENNVKPSSPHLDATEAINDPMENEFEAILIFDAS